jgi:hypothetical protein
MPDKMIDMAIPKKKVYARPTLAEYGEVARLSQSGATAAVESTGGMRLPCL